MARVHYPIPGKVTYAHVWTPKGGFTVACEEVIEGENKKYRLAFSFISPKDHVFCREQGRSTARGRLELGMYIEQPTILAARNGGLTRTAIELIITDKVMTIWGDKFKNYLSAKEYINPTALMDHEDMIFAITALPHVSKERAIELIRNEILL